MVQLEIKRRDLLGAKYSSIDSFGSKLICSECGSLYGRKVWHSNSIYRKTIYQCNHKFDEKKRHICRTPSLDDEEIKSKFIEAYSILMDDRDEIISNLKDAITISFATEKYDEKISGLKFDLDILEEKVKSIVAERSNLSSKDFEENYNEINKRYTTTSSDIKALLKEKEETILKRNKLMSFIYFLENEPKKIDVWSKQTWMVLVESAVVNVDGSITFRFYDGNEITIK